MATAFIALGFDWRLLRVWHSSRLIQEDETLIRETLENRGRSLSAEKHVHIVCGQVDCQQLQKVSWLTNGAESESFPRGRECFTSAQKHMFIVFAS